MEKNKNGLDDSNEKNVANSNIVEKYIMGFSSLD